ncbi:hypothetical protein TcCL_Unassigned03813, partial [Trypanosoma cruzi]
MHPRLQCLSTGADFSCQGICARFSLQCLFFFYTGDNRWSFVNAAAGCCCPRRDALNGGSSMTLCTKGMGLSPDFHRRRMPWTAEKECVPGVVHSSKEKMVLDGARRVDVDCVDRASQVYSLEALWATVASYEYNTFRQKNILNWSLRRNQCTWAMGLPRGLAGGDARRGRHSHRHSFPSPRQQHSLMRLHSLRIFRGGMHCSVCRLCFPIPSVGADSLVDASSYRLRTHPLIDAADTQPIAGASGMTAAPPQQLVQWNWGREHGRTSSIGWCWQPCQRLADPSDLPTPQASTETDGTGKASTDCQDTSCLSTSLSVKKPEEFTTTSFTSNEKGTTTIADSDSSTAVFYTPPPLFCVLFSRLRAAAAA